MSHKDSRSIGNHPNYPEKRIVKVGHVSLMAEKLEYFDSRTKVWGPDGTDDTIRDTATVYASEHELDRLFEKHDIGERVRLDVEDREFYSTSKEEYHINYVYLVSRDEGCARMALSKGMGQDD